MGADTKIEWADHTFNPWIGCTKVSPACAHCYAENNTATRTRGVKWGRGQKRYRTAEANWKKPLAWDREAKKLGTQANEVTMPHVKRSGMKTVCLVGKKIAGRLLDGREWNELPALGGGRDL